MNGERTTAAQDEARRRVAAAAVAGGATAVTVAIVLAFGLGGGGGTSTRAVHRRTVVTTPEQLPGAIPRSASDLNLRGQVSGRYLAQSARCGVQGFRAVGELNGRQVVMLGYRNPNGDTTVQLDAPGGSPLMHIGPGTWTFAANTLRFSSVALTGRDDPRTAVLDGTIHCA